MADPFQPKFVDLVRNFTFTAGTGNLVLGEAAPGFASFTDALQPGDSFYYSIAGLEKTSESEVGRGTLQANGSIAREAIDGSLTNFSNGKKTVALVAAAEWFEALNAVRGAPSQAATRAALAALPAQGAALLGESGREGLFRFEAGNFTARVAADSAQGIHIAPAASPSGSAGAWVRQFEGSVNPEWFGLVAGDSAGANAAANNAAWAAMIACLSALSVNTVTTYWQGLPDVRFGLGTYEFSAPIELASGAIDISGRGKGHGGAASGATRLKFYNSTGIRIQSSNTSGASTKDGILHLAGSYSTLRDLSIEGNFSGSEAEYHGVHARATFHAYNVAVSDFAGDGWRIEADSTTIGGNASAYTILNCDGWSCRNGLYEEGDNTSASTVIGGIWNLNRQWGLWQSNYLGNAHVGMEFATNGVTSFNDGASIGASVVTYGGNRYAVIVGQEASASTNAPSGTTADNAWWMFHKSGGVVEPGRPAWTSGMLVRSGGCIRDDNIVSKNTYEGCYAEQDQGRAQICQRSLVIGGMLADWCYQSPGATAGTAIIDGGNNGTVVARPAVETVSGSVTARLGSTSGNSANQIWSGVHASVSPSGHMLLLNTSLNAAILTRGNSTTPSIFQMLVTGETSTDQFGTGAAQPDTIYIPRLAVGPVDFNRSNARRQWYGTAAPTTAAHGQGEIVWNRSAAAGQPIGWTCIAGGTPGNWQASYALAQLQAAGSGLTVGATDKLLGRSSAGSGAVEEITCTSAGRGLIAGADAAAQRTSLGLRRGLGFHCAGAPAGSEIIGGGIAPYALTLSATNSSCKAIGAATAAVTLPIKKNGADIGSIAFAPSGTVGAITFTNQSVAAGDHITIHNPATADSTLADIDGLLAE